VAVAEHTLLLMLAVYRRILDCDQRVRSGGWGKDVARAGNRELRGKTVGVVGLGNIGREVTKRVRAFETEVVYFDVARAAPAVEEALGVTYAPLDDLLARADIVTLHLPYFRETRQLIDAARMAQMKPGAVLVNCARGELVDEDALADGLERGHLSGAGLDCVAHEGPGGGRRFWDMRNVVLSPHVAGVSIENFESMMRRAFANAQRFHAGEPLPDSDVI
jgi:D-3-phosphoglycerate dehydrogenase / 2-oxoglutarate reductase